MPKTTHHTGWAGALGVAAELSRRGYDATITLGNTPMLDLLCSSPSGQTFKVQVKSLIRPNWVFVQKSLLDRPPVADLYFAIVLVPEDYARPFEYHFLTHGEACDLYRQHPQLKKNGQPYRPGGDGLAWKEVRPHQDRWDKLPQ